MDEPDVPEVVRHFVDEKGLAGAKDASRGKILLAKRKKFTAAHLSQYSRIARIIQIRIAAAKISHDLLDIGKFLRTFNPGVRGQNLFQQRRTGARQSNDEYRIGILCAATQMPDEKLRRAHLDLLTRIVLDDVRAIPAFRALQGVTQLVVTKRFCVLSL